MSKARKRAIKVIGFITGLFLLVAIFTIGYIVWFRKSYIIPRQTAKVEYSKSGSNFFMYKGREMHYVDEGPSDSSVIVMVHGFMGSHNNFEAMAKALKGEFRVIRPDIPGFGLSQFFTEAGKPCPDLQQTYNDYFNFLFDSLKLNSFHLVGNSMGGMMAWVYAANNPAKIKSLALFCSAGFEMEKVLDKAAPILQYAWLEPLLRKGLPSENAGEGLKMCYANDSLMQMEDARFNNAMHNVQDNLQAAFSVASSGQYPDTLLLGKIHNPVLVVWGKEDEIIPYEHCSRFEKNLHQAKVITYSPCGHVPMMERTTELVHDYKAFLKENGLYFR